ncbi:MAG: hypothetical protein MK317_09070 [Pseudomonadales bacterium]|nr:hypothetical protein [Pseudomonadales bacterium]
MGYFGDNRDRYTPKSHGWTAGGTEWAKADMHRGYVPSHYSKPTKFGPFTVGDRFKTNQEMKEQEHGVTLRHEATPGNIAKGNTYKEGVGKGRGKIAGSTVHGGGNFAMRHKYQAKISNELRKNWARKNNPDTSVSNPMGWDD